MPLIPCAQSHLNALQLPLMQGLHLTADLYDCQCEPHWLTDAAVLTAALTRAVEHAGLTGVAQLAHTFAPTSHGPGGVTATVLLAESHVCVHTWPETRSVTLDVYVCNFSADRSAAARVLLTRLMALFRPMRTQEHTLQRGQPPRAPRALPVTASGADVATRPTSALVLAAGRGERMRPLTDTCPKPLLPVRGQPLLAWHVRALTLGGFDRLVFNTAWLGEQITNFFAAHRLIDGTFQLSFDEHQASATYPGVSPCFHALFSQEQADFGGALETAGGISRALPLLGAHEPPQAEDVFWVVAGDVFAPDFAFTQSAVDRFRASDHLAHIWLVPNPPHNPNGDFGLSADGLALNLGADSPLPRLTYSTIGLYRAALFHAPWCDITPGNPQGTKAALAPLLRKAMDAGRVSAEVYAGAWTDVGTPERLAQLNTTP